MAKKEISLKKIISELRDYFSSSNKALFAIDIGASCVKVAEVESKWGKKPKFILHRYGYSMLPEGTIIEDEIQKPEEIQEAIKEAVANAGITLKNCTLGLYGPNTVAKKLQLAGGDYEEIEDQVLWESEQYLPFSIDESSMDFHIVGENEGGGVDVIVAAVKEDVKYNYSELLKNLEITPKIIDLNTIAITNVFEALFSANDELSSTDSYLILDIGAQSTSFTIYRSGSIQFSKEILTGGVMITEEIQRRMGLNFYESEDLKTNLDENGNLPEEIVEIIEDILDSLFAEIKKTLDFYVVSTSDESLASCVITGGGVLSKGLLEGLEELLGVSVSFLNPLDLFTINSANISEDKLDHIMYQGGAVLGLGMREI